VLLAGGRGARLGLGLPKALVILGGRTLLERAQATLALACDEVLVCAPRDIGETLGLESFVADGIEHGGPLAGLVTGLTAARGRPALALGVDLPFMRPETLARLAELLGPHEAVVPAPHGRPQPLAAAYAPRAAERLARALVIGERRCTAAVLALDVRVLDAAEVEHLPGGADAFFNLNTPGDLAEAVRRLAAEHAA
jgi:molybdopterin-guanine dinucleotide biosynthesis protein A